MLRIPSPFPARGTRQEKETMKRKTENQWNRAMNRSGCGDLTIPDRYCTGPKNGHGRRGAYPSRMVGVPRQEHPSGSADFQSAIPEGTGKDGDT